MRDAKRLYTKASHFLVTFYEKNIPKTTPIALNSNGSYLKRGHHLTHLTRNKLTVNNSNAPKFKASDK
jgi:hypothetical protein